MDRDGKWPGGFVRKDGKGQRIHYIRKKIRGKLYEVSTRCTSREAAMEHLRRFEKDPDSYRADAQTSAADAPTMDKDTVAAFLAWSRDAKGNCEKYRSDQRRALKWWGKHVGGKDLRRLTTAELVRYLDGAPARKLKIATLKVFFTWLVTERHVLTAQQNPTLGLVAPQSRPEQWTNPKAVTKEDYQAVRAKLEKPWGDALDVLAGTGWHYSELARFAAKGRVERHPMGTGQVLACPQTKSGEPLRTEVSEAVAEAGRRVIGADVEYFAFRRALANASKAAGLKEELRPGFLRHSVATWAINSGAQPASVAAFLNHKSPRTTQRFYATHAVAAKVPTLL